MALVPGALLLVALATATANPPRPDPFDGPPPKYAGILDCGKVLDAAYRLALRRLDDPQCKLAFKQGFPALGLDTPLAEIFRGYVSILVTDDIPYEPEAFGLTHCWISMDTMVLAETLSCWAGPWATAHTIIHEYVHLISCPEVIYAFLDDKEVTMEFMEAGEVRADSIATTCMGGKF